MATNDDHGRELMDGWILVDGPQIVSLGTGAPPPVPPQAEVIDTHGAVVIPGMVNTHHHLFQTLQRNIPAVQDAKLFDWLTYLYQIWRKLEPEDVLVSALVGIGELLLTGCTTTADHFYLYPQDQPTDLLDHTIEAAQTLGIRFHPSRGSMSRGRSQGGLPPDDVVQDSRTILDDCERVIRQFHDPAPYSMCRISLAPCAPFTVTDDLLVETARLARKHQVRLHTHLAETKEEDAYCLATYGERPLQHMEKVEWSGPDVWYAHGIWLTPDELQRMARKGTGIAHCPTSNLRLGSGIAPIPLALDLGVPVGLAVDGSASNDSSNMLREVQICTLIHRVGTSIFAMPARKALRMATRIGAQLLGRDDLGQLKPGAAADIAVFRLDDLGCAGAMHDPLAALVFTTGTRRASMVLVNGQVVVRDGKLVNYLEQELVERANQRSEQMLERAGL